MYHKHLREDQWKQICSALSGRKGCVGRPVSDNRKFVEVLIWIGKTAEDGTMFTQRIWAWGSVHKRFKRWLDNGIQAMGFRQWDSADDFQHICRRF